MKKWIMILFFLGLTIPSHAGLFGITLGGKKKLQLMEAALQNNIKEQNMKIESLAKVVADLKIQVDSNIQATANINAQMGMINETVNNTVSAGRDSMSIMNNIDMDKVLLYGGIVFGISLILNFIQMLVMTHINGKRKDYKRSYEDSQAVIRRTR